MVNRRQRRARLARRRRAVRAQRSALPASLLGFWSFIKQRGALFWSIVSGVVLFAAIEVTSSYVPLTESKLSPVDSYPESRVVNLNLADSIYTVVAESVANFKNKGLRSGYISEVRIGPEELLSARTSTEVVDINSKPLGFLNSGLTTVRFVIEMDLRQLNPADDPMRRYDMRYYDDAGRLVYSPVLMLSTPLSEPDSLLPLMEREAARTTSEGKANFHIIP